VTGSHTLPLSEAGYTMLFFYK